MTTTTPQPSPQNESVTDEMIQQAIDNVCDFVTCDDGTARTAFAMIRRRIGQDAARIADLEKAPNRVLTLIPKDFDGQTGERGIHYEETADSPGGFMPCDIDELIEAIIVHVESAQRAMKSAPSSASTTIVQRQEDYLI